MEKLGRKKKVHGPMSSNGSKSNKIVVLQYLRESSGDGHSPTLKREKRSLRGDFKLLFEIFGICWRCSNTTTVLFFSSSSLFFVVVNFLLLLDSLLFSNWGKHRGASRARFPQTPQLSQYFFSTFEVLYVKIIKKKSPQNCVIAIWG